jgi:putative CocE/NonD family hydrolase
MGKPIFNRTIETRDIRVPMRDGTHLLTDLHQPVGGEDRPVFLMRTPYGRRAIGGLIERATALRGFQVVSQSCRGTFGSEGKFRPFRDDAEDGADTLDWLESQTWFHGQVVLGGLSYYGWAAWALLDAVDPTRISAMVIQHAAGAVRPVFRPSGVVALSTLANWVYLQSIREGGALRAWWGSIMRSSRVARALASGPSEDADIALTGGPVPFYREVYGAVNADDHLWSDTDHTAALTSETPPTHLMTAWFDFFLDSALADYTTLTARGAAPRLTISTGAHFPDAASMKIEYPEMFAWLRAATDPSAAPARPAPVRMQLLGSKEWIEFESWPPPAGALKLYPSENGVLAVSPPSTRHEAQFSFDTADPTPTVGGQIMYGAGRLDNRRVEGRSDVLTFTTDPLREPLTVIGVAHVSLTCATTAPETPIFVRLTEVTGDGRSLTLTDGIAVVKTSGNPQTPVHAEIELSATGFTVAEGHRLRLQVSSGSYPRFAAPPQGGTTTIHMGPSVVTELRMPTLLVLHDKSER